MDITYNAGQWTGPVNVENPVNGLGQPQDSFTVPTLVLGSDRQQEVADALRSTAATEIRIALERDRQQLVEQNASELEAMKASHFADLSALRQSQEAARVRLEEMKNGIEVQVEGLTDRFEKRFSEGETALKEKLAAAEAEFKAEIDALTGAHQVKVRELKASQSTELGSVVTAHLEELQKLETDHAKAVGTLIAEQEREMAEVASKLKTRKSSLETQLSAADEVLALQASLTARQTAIRVNDESIKAAEQERQVQFGKSLDGLKGTWTGTAACDLQGRAKGLTYTINFIGDEIVGRSISGEIKNISRYGSNNRGSAAQLHIISNDMTMPLKLKATLEDARTMGVNALDLTLQADGWMIGQSPAGTCTEVRLSKS